MDADFYIWEIKDFFNCSEISIFSFANRNLSISEILFSNEENKLRLILFHEINIIFISKI